MHTPTRISLASPIYNSRRSQPGFGPIVEMLRRSPLVRGSVVNARLLRSSLVDRWLGIRTAHQLGHLLRPRNSARKDSTHYEPTDYLLLKKLIKPLRLGSNDVVFEIGCGMGRTLCVLARKRVRKCVGIELMPELADIARRNAQTMRGRRAQVDVQTIDASQADYSEGTVFWLANPFGSDTMRIVLDSIGQSLQRRPRNIQIAYVYAKHEEVFRETPWLRLLRNFESQLFGSCYATYWGNCEFNAG